MIRRSNVLSSGEDKGAVMYVMRNVEPSHRRQQHRVQISVGDLKVTVQDAGATLN